LLAFSRIMLLTFSATLFVSAALLFLVQPMVGKMITPLLGGTPAVWNTCMVFFQVLLLAGYAYAHAATSWLGVRKQAALHLLLMLTAFAFFPLAIDRTRLADTPNPVVAALVVLTLSLGIPFFVVSSSAPLLQRWFTSTAHPAAKDPYFLYSASNLGSMLALLAYPVIVEPLLPLTWQRWCWCIGYGLLSVLAAACGVFLWKSASPALQPETPLPRANSAECLTWSRRLRWVALAAVPSSLLLGTTTYITTDVAPVPLLWVLPLTLYILSFILVFARTPILPHRFAVAALPPLVLLQLFLLFTNLWPGGIVGVITIHLSVLFVAAMVCHGELAADRPPAPFLTEFYLLMSVGGVLGGLFNSVLAPLVFNSLSEYQLALLALCALLPAPPGPPDRPTRRLVYGLLAVLLALSLPLLALRLRIGELRFDLFLQPQWSLIFTGLVFGLVLGYRHFRRAERATTELWLDAALPVAIGVLAVALTWGAASRVVHPFLESLAVHLGVDAGSVRQVLGIGIPAVLCYGFVRRPTRFALAVDALLVATLFCAAATEPPGLIAQKRGFFGVLRVQGNPAAAPDGKEAILVSLKHGTTTHGTQFRDLVDESRDRFLRAEPLSYYHRNGPIGQVFATYNTASRPFGVIGLGTGSLAAYGLPGQRVDFYEIDPLVRDFSFPEDGGFTFVADARKRGARLHLFMGDARLVLERESATQRKRYGLLVVDAFSSDAIPLHLLTREALRVYLSWLLDDGILCFHISNVYLDLKPVLANLAAAEGVTGHVLHDSGAEATNIGKLSSVWVVIARNGEHLNRLPTVQAPNGRPAGRVKTGTPREALPPWQPLAPDPKVGVWTDDYSNLLRVFKNLFGKR
jgi:hypothetical protein